MIADKLLAVLNSRTPELIAGNGHKPAGVLIPIQERRDDDYLVLTQRGEGLPTHKGQIAFPGGRVDAGDRDIFHTALRESEEEIGIDPKKVEILGRLDEFTAGYGLVVTPVVGVIPPHCEFRMDPRETTAVASVAIRALMARDNFVVDGQLSPGGHPSYHFYVNGWDVWGVTARIIVQFLELACDFKTHRSYIKLHK
ncbi:MAG: CoA pyrophosphatase [Deltaproteobacteria bacterium]|nr:CoA pyrophosphatase [Deltaproteobacteria bacterium]